MRLTLDRVTVLINWCDTNIKEFMAIISFLTALYLFNDHNEKIIPPTLTVKNIAQSISYELIASSIVGLVFSLITMLISTVAIHFLKKFLNQKYGNQKNK